MQYTARDLIIKLHNMGYTNVNIAKAIGVNDESLSRIVNGKMSGRNMFQRLSEFVLKAQDDHDIVAAAIEGRLSMDEVSDMIDGALEEFANRMSYEASAVDKRKDAVGLYSDGATRKAHQLDTVSSTGARVEPAPIRPLAICERCDQIKECNRVMYQGSSQVHLLCDDCDSRS